MQKLDKTLLIAVVTLLITINIYCETRYVSKTGSVPTPPYTSWATACDSLQKCFDYCQKGDTVYVDRGIYNEVLTVYNKNLTLIGIDTDECIIDGSGIEGKVDKYTMCWFEDSEINIDNLTFKYKRRDNNHFYFAVIYAHGYANVNNCIFDSTDNSLGLITSSNVKNSIFKNTISAIGVNGYQSPEIKIENNIIQILSAGDYPTAIQNGAGGGSFKIYNNIMFQNVGNNLFFGIMILTNKRVDIKNNLFYGFESAIQDGSFEGGYKDTSFIVNNTILNCKVCGIESGNFLKERRITNNIIANCKYGIYSYEYPIFADYNLYFKMRTSNYHLITPGINEIVADPMFNKDTTATLNGSYDFRLQKYSPAIDAGDPSILDVDGSRSDIGMYGGPMGISYEYKDLAPKQVKGVTAVYQQDTNRVKLTWKRNTESDFKQYYIYKDITANFAIDSTKRIGVLTDTLFYDILNKGTQKVYYKVTAIDSTGNECQPSTEINVTITNNDDAVITENYCYELFQNYPNPFNPTTTISYSLKDPGEVRIKLYTITGELIKTIIEGTKNKGYNETQIDLSTYSSGIYLYRLEVTGAGKIPAFNDLKKMVFVK